MRPWRPDPSLSAWSGLHRLPYDFSAHPLNYFRKGDGEEHKTLLDFPSPKSLNYYWLLIFYFNIVHLCEPITYKSLLGLACAHNTFTGIPVNVLLPVIPHLR